MKPVTLIIGSKASSSWSLRPWLFLKHHGVAFEEVVIPLDQGDTQNRILKHSPSGRVPALKHGPITVWESLSICEYAAETFGLPLAWPQDPAARALARSCAAEMHAGFADLRKEMPFKPTRKPSPVALTDRAIADIGRVRQIWRGCRKEHGKGGEWLFGAFGIVDAMFAPVALRFQSYAVALDGPEREYVYAMLMHPAINQWIEAAGQEPAPVSTLSGRMKERSLERTLEKTLDEKQGTSREITEPVRVDQQREVARSLRLAPPEPERKRPERRAEPELIMPEPTPEPHRSELILPSVPIVTLSRAPVRDRPTPPTGPAPATGPAAAAAENDPNEPGDDELPPTPQIKSFILPP